MQLIRARIRSGLSYQKPPSIDEYPSYLPGGKANAPQVSVLGLLQGVKAEMRTTGPGTSDGEDLCFEVVAAVLDVLSRLDALL